MEIVVLSVCVMIVVAEIEYVGHVTLIYVDVGHRMVEKLGNITVLVELRLIVSIVSQQIICAMNVMR